MRNQAELDALLCLRHIQREKALCSIGTLGGGNHFIELDRGEDGSYWLVIHSGSRRLGAEIAAYYQKTAFENCPDETSFEFAYATGALKDAYLHDMEIAQRFAELNRPGNRLRFGQRYEAGCGGHVLHRSQLH